MINIIKKSRAEVESLTVSFENSTLHTSPIYVKVNPAYDTGEVDLSPADETQADASIQMDTDTPHADTE